MNRRFSSLCVIGTLALLPTLLPAQWVQTSAPSTPVIDVSAGEAQLWFASRQAGVYTSTDEGASWLPRNNNLLTMGKLWRVSVFGDTVYAISDALQKMHVNDTTWSGQIAEYGTRNAVDVSGATIHVGYSLAGAIQRSTDYGNSWTFATIHQVPSLGFGFPQAYLNTGSALLVGHSFGIHRSTDGGATWDSVYANISGPSIMCFLSHTTGIYAGGLAGTSQILLRSTDNGVTWNSVPITNMLIGNGISSLVSSSQYLFAVVVGRGVYVSPVSPISWTLANNGLTSPNLANTLVVMNNNVYLASGSASTGFGVWRRPVSQLTSVEPGLVVHVPSALGLHQNYPNPFNPSTTISYELARWENVHVAVYDLLGREVAILVDEAQNAGPYTVVWDASGFGSGSYFVRLRTHDDVHLRSMLLVR